MAKAKKENFERKIKKDFLILKLKSQAENLDDYSENKIEIPRSSFSNSNNISKINTSFPSKISINQNNETKIEKNKINFSCDIESIKNLEGNFDSSFYFGKSLLEEYNHIQKIFNENEK
jgi:hypothetical protein